MLTDCLNLNLFKTVVDVEFIKLFKLFCALTWRVVIRKMLTKGSKKMEFVCVTWGFK